MGGSNNHAAEGALGSMDLDIVQIVNAQGGCLSWHIPQAGLLRMQAGNTCQAGRCILCCSRPAGTDLLHLQQCLHEQPCVRMNCVWLHQQLRVVCYSSRGCSQGAPGCDLCYQASAAAHQPKLHLHAKLQLLQGLLVQHTRP